MAGGRNCTIGSSVFSTALSACAPAAHLTSARVPAWTREAWARVCAGRGERERVRERERERKKERENREREREIRQPVRIQTLHTHTHTHTQKVKKSGIVRKFCQKKFVKNVRKSVD